MKTLKENLQNSLNESLNLTTQESAKLEKMLDPNKLRSYIKKHEDELTTMHLGSSDIDDIAYFMNKVHEGVSYLMDTGKSNQIPDCLHTDIPENLADDTEDADETWIEPAIDLYVSLFKEATGKDLK